MRSILLFLMLQRQLALEKSSFLPIFGTLYNYTLLLFVYPYHAGNQYLKAQASPVLFNTLWQAATLVKCPDEKFTTVYDQWMHFTSKNYNGTTRPL